MTDLRIYVAQDTLPAAGENSWVAAMGSKRGELYIADFFLRMVMERRAYQVRAGTISVPLVGDVVITDTAAEMCADCALGTTIIPVYANISFNLAAASLFETAAKSVATVSSAGTAFTPLPLYSGGAAAGSTARVAATAGTVTVTAEMATTTLRHFSWSQPIAAGAWPTWYDWEPKMPPVLNGPRCFYLQIAGDTTGPSYYAHFDYIELPTDNVS